jgi:hypothetical protein
MDPLNSKKADEIREERRQLRAQYHEVFEEMSLLLFRHDPVGINFETNTDEYEPEVGTILPRLKECESAADVQRIVHEEFIRWFDSGTAGPIASYTKIADEIWQIWQKFKSSQKS